MINASEHTPGINTFKTFSVDSLQVPKVEVHFSYVAVLLKVSSIAVWK